MSKPIETETADAGAGQKAFKAVVQMIKNAGMAETGACVAAGLPKNLLSQARSDGQSLSLPSIEKFANLFKTSVAQLIGERAPKKEDGAAKLIPLLDIHASPLNPRKTFDADAIAELAESIAAQGLLQNLVVTPGPTKGLYTIVAGERRFRALDDLRKANRLPADLADGIPCRVVNVTPAEHLALAILENLQRQDVNPMEEADGFAQLQAMDPQKYTTAHIAQQIGTTQRHVQLRLQLVRDLTDETQGALRDGKISLATARVLTIAPAKKQKELLKSGAAANYKAEDLKRQIKQSWKLCSEARFDWTAPELAQYITVDDGTEWFVDQKKFKQLQLEAVERLRAGAGDFAWVEVSGWYAKGDYEPEMASPVTRGGRLIVYSEYFGTCDVYEGLVRKQSGTTKSAAQVREERIREEWREEYLATLETFQAAVRDALRPRDAIMLMLFDMMSLNYGSQEGPLQGGLATSEPLLSGPLKRLAGSVQKRPGHSGNAIFKENVSIETAWAVLDGLKDEDLAEAITLALAPTVHLRSHRPVHPAFFAIARKHGIDIPEILLRDEAAKAAEIARRTALPDAQTDIEDAIAEQDAA